MSDSAEEETPGSSSNVSPSSSTPINSTSPPGGESSDTNNSALIPSNNDYSTTQTQPPSSTSTTSTPQPSSNSTPPSSTPSALIPLLLNSTSSLPPTPPASNTATSNSQPPTSSSPPPPQQSSTPPTNSLLSPPPPPSSPSNSPPPTPAQKSPPPSSGHSSPPPPNKSLTAPPPSSGTVSPPPAGRSNPSPSPSPPTQFTPPPSPPVSNGPVVSSQSSPPPPTKTPSPPSSRNSSAVHSPPTSPLVSNGPLASSKSSPPPPTKAPSPPSSTNSSTGHSPPTSSDTKNSNLSNTSSRNGNEGGGDTTTKAVVGAVVASLVLIAVIAIFLAVSRRRKRQKPYASHYTQPPNNFTVNTDGYYYRQNQKSVAFSGPPNHSYGSQTPHTSHGDSYESQRGNMFQGGGPDSGVIGGSKTYFSYEEVMEVTNGFSHQNIIGEGGFGCVYKGWMPDGKVVAVKQLKAGSGQGDREFKAEVEIISRVHHRHLVSLVGYCISDSQRMLIYEFVPNRTLEYHLHARGLPVLHWPKRLKIAIGSAKGLAYLHEDCHPKIIHRDIKSANILLDDDFEAQVADFGLARLNDTTQTHVSTRVMGTFGYLAPEYASSGKLTDRSDVFSFGVVLLELITGRKPVDPTQPLGDESLVEWARPLLIHALETGDLGELVDPRLEKHYVESEMLRMVETAAACVRHSAPKRPRMVQVMRALDSEGEMSDLSNGVKYGQSTAYDSGQYNQEIMKFRRMALGSDLSSEFDTWSGEYTSRDLSHRATTPSDYTSGESETRAMNQSGGRAQGNHSGREFV